jgi:hypothetical protein
MINIDYSSSWVANAIRALWLKIKQIEGTSAVIDPSGFTKNLLGQHITNPQQLANAVDQLQISSSGVIVVRYAVTPNGTNITFTTPFIVGTVYDLLPYCYDDMGTTVDFSIANKTNTGFTVYSATNAVFICQIIIL